MGEQKYIRNFAIIAHVDHGKSTLADRFLEITGTISKDNMKEQFLDQNPISRERGITIKLAPVRMEYQRSNSNVIASEVKQSQQGIASSATPPRNDDEYILNLIDTPGHVDFSYEVSRTLAACEGAILLVDATQGIQAQTVAHCQAALKEGLTLIPVVNKIDLPNAQVNTTKKELTEAFGFRDDEIILISAKTGENVEKLLEEVVRRIPSPEGSIENPLKALIFDAQYDEYKGVVAYVRIVDGNLQIGENVLFYQNGIETSVVDVGYFSPFLTSSKKLATGEIGYVTTGIKDIRKARVGDTITNRKSQITNRKFEPLPGYKLPKPMVFFGVYPKDQGDFVHLRESLAKLTLNDTALTYKEEYSSYLGSGFRVGFLGLLHAEIVKERLKQEFSLDLLLTQPQVLYEKRENGEMLEPYMKLIVYAPSEYIGNIMPVCQKRKGALINMSYHQDYAVLEYQMPYSMFIRGLSAELKSASSGFASVDYELVDYREADVVKLEIAINGEKIDILSELAYKEEALYLAREKVAKLKDSLPRQQFRQIIQGMIDGTIVAREELSPFRKDVLAKMSGGDRTRKDKLLKKQKKGKSRLETHGKISLPQEALFSLLRSS